MKDPASLLTNPNFAPRVTDPNLRSLITDADFWWRMKEYLRKRQLEIEGQGEPQPHDVYVDQPSGLNVWEREVISTQPSSYLLYTLQLASRLGLG